jgi:phosphatidylserine synthase 2
MALFAVIVYLLKPDTSAWYILKIFLVSVPWMIMTQYGIRNASGIWFKSINGVVMVYAGLLLLGILTQDRAGVLEWTRKFFGTGFPLPEKDYGDVCSIHVPDHPSGNPWFNVTDRIDIFVIAHALGWFVKGMIMRDVRVAWICSIFFEFVEIAFAHWLPNFNECWWDSIIMDVFGCNMIGIHVADILLKRLGMTRFDFLNRSTSRQNNRALFAGILLIVLITLIDLNFFFMKFVFFVPTTHWLSWLRTLIWVLISIPGALELFEWTKSKTIIRGPRVRISPSISFMSSCPSCVIGAVGLGTEILSYIYFRDGLFADSPTTPLMTIVLVATMIYAVIWTGAKALFL